MIVEYVVEADPSAGMRGLRTADYDRERTINVKFVAEDGGFLVIAWGQAFPTRNGGSYQGRLRRSLDDIRGSIGELLQRWRTKVLEFRAEGPTGRGRFPYVNELDLSEGDPDEARKMWLELARIGAVLFDFVFPQNDDEGMAEISRILEEALLADDQVVRFESDEIFAPWGMLYVGGASAAEALNRADPEYVLDRFLGLRHLVEHSVTVGRGSRDHRLIDSRILLRSEPPVVGLNVDRLVDRMPPAVECMTEIVEFFHGRAEVVVRPTKDDLREALSSPALADTVHFYGCHGAVDKGTDGIDRPFLKLEDQEYIFSTEFQSWLGGRQFRSGPLVFMSSCEGGQLSTFHYTAFGRYLLDAGARCMVGPQLDLPRLFAKEFVKRVFGQFLVPSTRLGDVLRDVARDFAFDQANPLGLIMSLYRGIDVHLHLMPA